MRNTAAFVLLLLAANSCGMRGAREPAGASVAAGTEAPTSGSVIHNEDGALIGGADEKGRDPESKKRDEMLDQQRLIMKRQEQERADVERQRYYDEKFRQYQREHQGQQ